MNDKQIEIVIDGKKTTVLEIDVTKMVRRGVRRESAVAAETAAVKGLSPKAQLDAAKAASSQKGLGYFPHQGPRERARRLKRMGPALAQA